MEGKEEEERRKRKKKSFFSVVSYVSCFLIQAKPRAIEKTLK